MDRDWTGARLASLGSYTIPGILAGVAARFWQAPSSGRFPARDFLASLPSKDSAAIAQAIDEYATHGRKGALQWKAIKGHRPMIEIKQWGFRAFCAEVEGDLVVLEVCKKQDQERGIERAAARMRQLLGR